MSNFQQGDQQSQGNYGYGPGPTGQAAPSPNNPYGGGQDYGRQEQQGYAGGNQGGYGHPSQQQTEPMMGNQRSPPQGQATPPGALTYLQFAAAACVTFGGIYGALWCILGEFQPVNCIMLLYIGAFGMLLMILDTPFMQSVKGVRDYKHHVCTYVHLLTRAVGKGMVLIFTGVMVWVGLWMNAESLVLACFMGGFIFVVGALTAGQGVHLSVKLNKIRAKMGEDGPGPIASLTASAYQNCCSQRQLGLTTTEFDRFCVELAGMSFPQKAEQYAIFNALSKHDNKEFVTIEDLQGWKDGLGLGGFVLV